MSGLLVVFAKRPARGRVKTRLCPPFRPEEAADFYAAMLGDVVAASAAAAAANGLAVRLAVDPPEAVGAFAGQVPDAVTVVPQRGDGLAARMEHAASEGFAAGHAPVLLRGSDSPLLAPDTVAAALAALTRCALAVCPDRDGGYNLVGLARPSPGVFDHPMSTASVLEDTLARAREAGLGARVLPTGFDIDTAEDLRHLAAFRSDASARALAPRTFAWLDDHGRWPD